MRNHIRTALIVTLLFVCATAWVYGDLWTPEYATNTVLWLDASDADTIHTDDSPGFVSRWDDKSGNTNDVVQAATGTQPAFNASDIRLNNMPTVGYDNAYKYLDTVSSISVKRVYVVTYYDDPDDKFDSYRSLIASTDNNDGVGGQSGANSWQGKGIWSTRDFYKDGSTNSSGTGAALPMSASQWRFSASATSASKIWRILGGASSYRYWEYGAIGEIIFTDGTEDTATQQQIEGYLAWKWGLGLPIGHPYKDAAPLGPPPAGTVLVIR